ncbi:MAG TPA: aminoglycoside phosphotransferase family protein [Pseudonocardiaceae bacterium]|nr:aminoglycoside phosphotransferase family protein [Pseudonocardiaceae bacterium]
MDDALDPNAATTDAVTRRLVRRFGPSVTAWAAGLPDLVGRLAERWRLTVGEPFGSGASSVAIRVTTATGGAAVLKLSPDLPFAAEQVAVLRQFAASGRVPDVLADDAELGAVLLSEIRPGTPAHELPIPPTPAAYARLLTALHSVDRPPPGVLPRDARQWIDEFMHRAMGRLAEPAIGAHLYRSDFERALREVDRLLATPSATVLLHGDLHFGNVLDGGERGLMAIDPKACLGDPCFDAVDYVTGGAGRPAPDGVHQRLTELATEADLDPDRLLAWCRAVIPVNALPLLARGDVEAANELLAISR